MLENYQKEKIKFVEAMNPALQFIRMGVAAARYEFWENEFGDIDEFLIIDYGNSIDVRNCSGDSCLAILDELTKLVNHPKWDEVPYYEENYLNNPKARRIDPDEDLFITAVNGFLSREYESDEDELLQEIPQDGIVYLANTSYEEEEGSPEIQVNFDCKEMRWKNYVDGKLLLNEPRSSYKAVAEELNHCTAEDLTNPVHDLIRKD